MADFGPVFSPDGRRIAFIRSKATNNAIFILPVSPAMAPAGEPVQVVSDPRRIDDRRPCVDAGRPEPRVLVGRTRGAHSARTARLVAELEARRPAAGPALRRTCHPNQHRAHRTHGVLGPAPGCEFLEARCGAAWRGPRGRGSFLVHARRDNALILSGRQAGRVHLHPLRFRGALDLQCRRRQPAPDDVDGRPALRPAHTGRRTASQSCSTPPAKGRPTCISCFPERARSVV